MIKLFFTYCLFLVFIEILSQKSITQLIKFFNEKLRIFEEKLNNWFSRKTENFLVYMLTTK